MKPCTRETCPNEVLEFISDLTVKPPVNGDLRYALDLLLYAGNLADSSNSKTILPEHVRTVHSETYHLITTEDILNLPGEEKLVLMAVARTLQGKKTSYVSLREIRNAFEIMREEFKSKAVSTEEPEDYVQDLADRGILDIKGINRIGISGVSLEDMSKFLNSVPERVGNRFDSD